MARWLLQQAFLTLLLQRNDSGWLPGGCSGSYLHVCTNDTPLAAAKISLCFGRRNGVVPVTAFPFQWLYVIFYCIDIQMIWHVLYLYYFMLNKSCLSLSLSLMPSQRNFYLTDVLTVLRLSHPLWRYWACGGTAQNDVHFAFDHFWATQLGAAPELYSLAPCPFECTSLAWNPISLDIRFLGAPPTTCSWTISSTRQSSKIKIYLNKTTKTYHPVFAGGGEVPTKVSRKKMPQMLLTSSHEEANSIITKHATYCGHDPQSNVCVWFRMTMMTSSNGNIFRVTGHLCGEFTGDTQRPVTRSFDVFFDLRPNKRLSKQWWGWWFETQSCPLWRHRNALMCCASWLSLQTWNIWYQWGLRCPLSHQFMVEKPLIFAQRRKSIWKTSIRSTQTML